MVQLKRRSSHPQAFMQVGSRFSAELVRITMVQQHWTSTCKIKVQRLSMASHTVQAH